MGRSVTITKEAWQNIANLYGTGEYSYAEIAACAGVSRSTVQLMVTEYRISRQYPEPLETETIPNNSNGHCRVAGDFTTFGAQYLGCQACRFRWWNAFGAPVYCPRCNHQRPAILYRPSAGG